MHVRKELVSNTVTQLLQNTHSEQVGSSAVQSGSVQSKEMEGRAVKK